MTPSLRTILRALAAPLAAAPLLALVLVSVASCGRVGFDPKVTDAGLDGGGMDAGDGGPDGGVDAGDGGPDACVFISDTEQCNGRDDDCNGVVDEGWMTVPSPDLCDRPTAVRLETLIGQEVELAFAASSAVVATGSFERDRITVTFGAGLGPELYRRTLGQIFSGSMLSTAEAVLFPELGGGSPEPDVDRMEIEVFWPGYLLENGSGPDLAIFSAPEARPYAVSFRVAGAANSPRRYQFPTRTEAGVGSLTLYELDDFGYTEGDRIGRVLISNLFTSDRVDAMAGQGRVLREGDIGYNVDLPQIRVSDGGPIITVADLGADPVYVVALQGLINDMCCVRP